MDWKEIGERVAQLGLPLLGAALPVPGGAAIGAALAAAIGAEGGTPEAVLKALTADAEAVLKAKEFELSHQAAMLQITTQAETRLYEIEVDDRKSARASQVGGQSKVPAILAGLVTCGFFGVLIGMMTGDLKSNDNQALLLLLGSLATAWGATINYYFGSTSDSRRKTEMIAASWPGGAGRAEK